MESSRLSTVLEEVWKLRQLFFFFPVTDDLLQSAFDIFLGFLLLELLVFLLFVLFSLWGLDILDLGLCSVSSHGQYQ
jgi:hypothetical protein